MRFLRGSILKGRLDGRTEPTDESDAATPARASRSKFTVPLSPHFDGVKLQLFSLFFLVEMERVRDPRRVSTTARVRTAMHRLSISNNMIIAGERNLSLTVRCETNSVEKI